MRPILEGEYAEAFITRRGTETISALAQGLEDHASPADSSPTADRALLPEPLRVTRLGAARGGRKLL